MILEWEQYCWNGFIWKCIRLQTAWHVIHKYKHLPKKKRTQPSFDDCCHDDSLAQEKCYMVGDARAAWHISVEFITHMKRNQFYSTVTLTFTEKWNGGLEMKTSSEIPTREFVMVPSSCPASRRSSMPGPRIFSHGRWQPIRPSLLSD